MTKIAICDDEKYSIIVLKNLLKGYEQNNLMEIEVFSYTSGKELLQQASFTLRSRHLPCSCAIVIDNLYAKCYPIDKEID